jgi:hypothetical protein
MYYTPSIYDFNSGRAFKAEKILCEFIEWVGEKSVKIRLKGFYKNRINQIIVVRRHNVTDLPGTAPVSEAKQTPGIRNFYEVEKEPVEVDPQS